MFNLIALIIAIAAAYALGSVNTAIIYCKFMGLEDPRKQGSNNPGATNVMRMAGKQAAAIILVADVAKGFIAVLIGRVLGLDGFMLGMVAVAATTGHMFPFLFEFKGGKGVATAFGAVLGITLVGAILLVVIWAVVAYMWRYVSLASMCAAAASPLVLLFTSGAGFFIPLALLAALIVWRHMDNIKRLQEGSESKLEL